MRSIKTIPLLMMIPARLSKPKMIMNPNTEFMMINPIVAPMNVSGMVSKMMPARRKELNCQTSNRMIPAMA